MVVSRTGAAPADQSSEHEAEPEGPAPGLTSAAAPAQPLPVADISDAPQHPFYVPSHGGYVDIGELEPGALLMTRSARPAALIRATLQYGSFVVYNLEVAGSHNYFVGSDDAVLVHNACKKAAERALKENKDFRRWFHREFKGDQGMSSGGRHNPDLEADQILEAFEEWLSLGSPRVK